MAESALFRLCLLTEGDPGQLTGGYLYQQQMAAYAACHGAGIEFASIRPGRLFQQHREVRRRLAELQRYDALLLDSLVAAPVAPLLPALARHVPVIALAHQQPGGADQGMPGWVIRKSLDLRAYRSSHGAIAVSKWLAERLRAGGVPPERICVVTPGRYTDASSGTPADLRRGRGAAVLCVSNWRRNKNIDLLLEAVATLDPPAATLHLVGEPSGDRSYERQLRARLARTDLRDRVVVHGAISPAEVNRLMHSADVLLHGSRHESYGSAVAEAMVIGLPVVAFAVDNLPYLIRDGEDGLLVPFGDVPWLSAALRLLVEDPARRSGMGAAARARAMSWPTWSETADRFFSFIRPIAGRHHTENFK